MIVILDNIRSAENVGSIIRTAEGLGIKSIYLCGITPGVGNGKVQKASLGAEDNLTITEERSTLETVLRLKAKGTTIIALEITNGAKPINNLHIEGEFALVVGNEVSGVAPEVIKAANVKAMIPMAGQKESFNVSVAFGIAAYALLNQSK